MIPERIEIFMKLMLLLLVLVIVIPLGCWLIRRFLQKRPAYQQYKSEAKAIVLTIEPTGLFLNKQPQVKLQMQVLPDKGRNFVAEIKAVFSPADLELIHAGSTMKVKYNPSNIKEVVLVPAA